MKIHIGLTLAVFSWQFALGFTVAVEPTKCSIYAITSPGEQLFAGTGPPGSQAISVNVGVGTPSTILFNNTTFAGNTGGNVISPGVLTLTKTATSSGITNLAPLLSFDSDVRQTITTTIPEPVTLSLVGISLLGLGYMGRRRGHK
jgi:hypothetical protein